MKKAQFFIIPNSLVTGTEGDYWFESYKKRLSRILGINEVKDGQRFIQLWFHSADCDNWQDGGIPKDLTPETEIEYMPTYLPVEMVENMKEGDKMTLKVFGKEVEFTARQFGFRYQRFGKFEDVISELV